MTAKSLLTLVGTSVSVFGLAFASLLYTRLSGHVAGVWPANAVILGVLMRSDARGWGALLMAGLAGLAGAMLATGAAVWSIPLLALCNGLEAFTCAVVLRKVLGRRVDLARAGDLLVFVLAGLVVPLVWAAPAAFILSIARHGPALRYLFEWWASTALGLLILTPTLVSLTPEALARLVVRQRLGLTLALSGLLAVCLALVALQDRFSLLFLLMPVLILITFQLELAGGALAMLVTAAAVLVLSAMRHGPPTVMQGDLVDQSLEIQVFLAAASMSVLAAAAVHSRQRRLMASLRQSLAETEAARAHALEHQRGAAMAGEVAKLGHWSLDVRTGEGVWSGEIYRIYGLDPGRGVPNLGDTIKFYHPDDRAHVEAIFAAARRDGRPFRAALRIVRPDGELRQVLSSGAAERDAQGRVTAVFGVIMDVTEAKEAEAELRRSEERYRMLAERVTDMILRYDTRGVIEFVAPSVSQLGYDPEQVVGLQVTDLVHPEDRGVVLKARRDVTEGPGVGEERHYPDVRVRRADGSWVWIQGNPAPIRDDTGAIVGVVTVLRDVTARRGMEDELRRKKAEAEAAAIAKTEFLANMSHEIRTPLTAIIGFSGLLEKAPALPDDARRHVRHIVAGGQALFDVVNDILDFSKLEAGQVELDPQPFNPAALFDGVIALVAGQAASKGLEVRLRRIGELPPLVVADAARLKQVLLNLLSNAIKFTEAGRITVTARYQLADGVLRVAVEDTGCGIPADKRDRLFQRFSQVDSSITRRHGGSGLGLAICKNLIVLMDGEIEVESELGVGSTFTFAAPAPISMQAPKAAERAAQARPVTQPADILIVDDRAENRELVRRLLEAAGHTVEEAGGGSEAVKSAKQRRFDLILMDLQMPEMDGIAAAEAVRSTAGPNRDTPIVALSANVLAEQVAQCLAAGMNDHVGKPIRVEELLAMVDKWTAMADAPADETSAG